VARFDRAIPPGGAGEIAFSLNTSGYQGLVRKSALVYTNDPEKPKIKLTLQAQVEVPIAIEPRGSMLHGIVGDEIKQVVTITAHEDRHLALEPDRLSPPDKVAYEIKVIEQGRIYQVVLRNISTKKDRYSGFLALKTNYPEKPVIHIRFLGYIRGNLQIQPERIDFGRIETTMPQSQKHARSPYQRSIIVSLHRGQDLKIERVETNHQFLETQVEEIQQGKRYRIDVKLNTETIPRGLVNDTLRLYTNVEDDPIRVVPIRVHNSGGRSTQSPSRP
jgi:hypothetical protein